MPKGKTSQPLIMMVTPEVLQAAQIQALAAAGHTIKELPREALNVDLILGANCHIMTEDMLTKPGIMVAAMKAARKRRKESKNA